MVSLRSNPFYQKLMRTKDYFCNLHTKTMHRIRMRNRVAVAELSRLGDETFYIESEIEDLSQMLNDYKMVLNFKVESGEKPAFQGKRLMQILQEKRRVSTNKKVVVEETASNSASRASTSASRASTSASRASTSASRASSSQSSRSTRSILEQSRNGSGNQNKFL